MINQERERKKGIIMGEETDISFRGRKRINLLGGSQVLFGIPHKNEIQEDVGVLTAIDQELK